MEKGVIRGICKRTMVCDGVEQRHVCRHVVRIDPKSLGEKRQFRSYFINFRPVYKFILDYKGKHNKQICLHEPKSTLPDAGEYQGRKEGRKERKEGKEGRKDAKE